MENKLSITSAGTGNELSRSIPSTPNNPLIVNTTEIQIPEKVVEIKGPVDFKDGDCITVNKISIHDPVGIKLRALISNWDIKDMTKEDSGYARGTTEQAQEMLDIINSCF